MAKIVEIIWSDSALSDLSDIADYIAVSNHDAAGCLMQRVYESVSRLGLFPESGRVPQELETLNYREVVVNPCRIFYKYEADKEGSKVYILHVMRQEQDLRRYLLN